MNKIIVTGNLTKMKWLKAKYNNYDNIKPVLSEKDKELEERLEEERKTQVNKI